MAWCPHPLRFAWFAAALASSACAAPPAPHAAPSDGARASRPDVARTASPSVSRAFAEHCAQRLAPGAVRVVALHHAPDVRTDLSVDQLGSIRTEGHHDDARSTLGVTVAKLRSSLAVRSRYLSNGRTGETCMRPDIEATLTYSPMEVFVAREFADHGCVYEHILEHEMRHVKAHEAQLDHARRKLEAELQANFGGRIFYGEADALRRELEDAIRLRWLPLAMSYLQEVRSVHERIDTPEEYARNRTACGGMIARALDQRRGAGR